MGRPRKYNKGLPERWDFKNGVYSYLTRKHERQYFDNKSRFRLGTNLSESHKLFAERLNRMDRQEGQISTLGQAFDQYALRRLPELAAATQQGYIAHIKQLKLVFKDVSIHDFKPSWAYKYFESKRRTSAAHHEVKMLNTVFSWLVSIGELDKNPIKGEVKIDNPSNKPKRYIEDWEITEIFKLQPKTSRGGLAQIQSYIALKLLTGMSKGDLLRLQPSVNFTDDGIEITRHKTRNKTGKQTIYEWTPALKQAVETALKTRPVDISPFLFCTKNGDGYMNEDTGKAEGFKTSWRTFMKRLFAETDVKERFTEHDLRRKVGSDADSLQHAQELLSHSDAKTTASVYRAKPVKVTPLK